MMKKQVFKSLLIVSVIINNSASQNQMYHGDVAQIAVLVEDFIHSVAADMDYDQYLSQKYVFLNTRLNNTKFHIINDFKVQEIKLEKDYAIAFVKIDVDKTLTYRSFTDGDDIELVFELRKNENGDWKITDQINRGNSWPYANKIYFMDFEVIYYLPSLINYLYETDAGLYTLDEKVWKNMVRILEKYYHTEFLFNRNILRRFTLHEIQVLRNSIFAYYGREFQTPWLQNYFASKSWYKPDSAYHDFRLSETDLQNIKLIKEVEESYSPRSVDDLMESAKKNAQDQKSKSQ